MLVSRDTQRLVLKTTIVSKNSCSVSSVCHSSCLSALVRFSKIVVGAPTVHRNQYSVLFLVGATDQKLAKDLGWLKYETSSVFSMVSVSHPAVCFFLFGHVGASSKDFQSVI